MLKVSKFWCIVFAFGVLCACESKDTKTPQKPNVLLLYMDDLRPELASFGASQIISPNIDALADRGVKFTNAYCNVPVCGASRASMLTGMLPTKNRFLNYDTFVEKETPNAITLPQLFKNNGYTTISNGKIYHHLDDRETDWNEIWRPYAFDKNDQGLAPTDYWQSLWKDYQNPENRAEYKTTNTGPAYEMADINDSIYIDGLLTEKVVRDIKKLKSSDKPFFLTAGFIAPHLPFNAPKKYWDLYDRNNIKQPKNYNYIPKDAPKMSISNWPEMRAYSNIPKEGQVSDSLAIDLIHGYYATVSYVDALVGKILVELKTQNLAKNTIVILVSDHGYNLQEHTQWAKFTNYNTSMQVPMIVYNPFSLAKGESGALIELIDVYPTLAETCGLKIPKDQLDGKSFVSLLNNPEANGKEHILIKKGNGFTLKTPNFSYTEFIRPEDNSTITSMLYDHRIDKSENVNVVDHKEYAETILQLKNTLHNDYKSNIEGTK
ncbi:sulfatase [Aureibaculum sp. 2210JD6-5]|uniref:sulfatase n=1 Tax=Aureibaculum sp. 2210JD6-5 TaxID=3103957 RepID=UPI002AAD578D|nr:sulfatase [Aureibaculum sp. 2210JD6-5]MDY7396797.1 sulfatase [Aureibaculum sp. 2210JD6-5]